jgi:hypothetical protein
MRGRRIVGGHEIRGATPALPPSFWVKFNIKLIMILYSGSQMTPANAMANIL